MTGYTGTLNDAQQAVLAWVGEGCPDGRFDGYAHRVSASALRSRGLVRITGRGPTWNATLTAAGRAYLEEPPQPSPGKRRSVASTSVARRSKSRPPAGEGQEQTSAGSGGAEPASAPPKLTKTEQLVADLVAAGDVMRTPLRFGGDGPNVRQRAYAAQDAGKLPPGKRLTTTVIGTELEIRLVDAADTAGHVVVEDLIPVPVPQRVRRYHSAARAFRDLSECHEVSREQLGRATRIIHALAVAAERRGWEASAAATSRNGYGREGWTPAKDGHLRIAGDDAVYTIRLQEEGVKLRGPWEIEVDRARRYWSPSPFRPNAVKPEGAYDAKATGRLNLRISDGSWWQADGRQKNWADRQSWSLEERLPHVLREIDSRAQEAKIRAEQQRIARAQAAERARIEAEECERRWHQLMDQAREGFVEEHRANELRNQVDAWKLAVDIRAYCDAMQAAHPEVEATIAWVEWARAYAARLDPLRERPRMPDDVEPTHDDLARHLPAGWSPYGPEHREAWRRS